MSGLGRAPHGEMGYDETDDRVVISSPEMELVFVRAADRWTHFLRLIGSGTVDLMHVVEGDPARDSPARVVSPVYQEVHHHELAGGSGRCLLLTGRSFQHHFSAAVTMRFDDEMPGSLVADFDIADRCRTAVDSLAATYLAALDSGALIDADPTVIRWNVSGAAVGRLEMLAVAPTTLALAEAGRQATRVQALAALDEGGFTRRFRYRWRWTSVSGVT
jgi:hypothetical protein